MTDQFQRNQFDLLHFTEPDQQVAIGLSVLHLPLDILKSLFQACF